MRNPFSSKLVSGKDVLLFFRGRDKDTFVRGDHRVRQTIREATIPLRAKLWPHKQQVVGYEVSFDLLRRALKEVGMRVHINRYGLAKANPGYPVSLSGFPTILEDWNLRNPAILGPGLYDHPKRNPTLMTDPRYKKYLVKSEWLRDLCAKYYGADRVATFFSGIDTTEWPDTKAMAKDVDFLIYDKIRWNREVLEPTLLEPIVERLQQLGKSYKILRYGRYDFAEYRSLLQRSTAMIFLCEHETQGMAWQEALASNLPIMAWDQGFWLDPVRPNFESEPVPASSVPGFSSLCGERFKNFDEFHQKLPMFLESMEAYEPRRWVKDSITPSISAKQFLGHYWDAAGSNLA